MVVRDNRNVNNVLCMSNTLLLSNKKSCMPVALSKCKVRPRDWQNPLNAPAVCGDLLKAGNVFKHLQRLIKIDGEVL